MRTRNSMGTFNRAPSGWFDRGVEQVDPDSFVPRRSTVLNDRLYVIGRTSSISVDFNILKYTLDGTREAVLGAPSGISDILGWNDKLYVRSDDTFFELDTTGAILKSKSITPGGRTLAIESGDLWTDGKVTVDGNTQVAIIRLDFDGNEMETINIDPNLDGTNRIIGALLLDANTIYMSSSVGFSDLTLRRYQRSTGEQIDIIRNNVLISDWIGSLIVVDVAGFPVNNPIAIIDKSGNEISSALIGIGGVTGLTVHNNEIYISRGSRKILVLDNELNLVREWDT